MTWAFNALFLQPEHPPLERIPAPPQDSSALASAWVLPVLLPDQEDETAAWAGLWLERVAALEAAMADMGQRCPLCYDLRLERVARAARKLGFLSYCTTLLYSRYQNQQAIIDAGMRHAGRGVSFLAEDFRPGWSENIRLSKEWGVYRQQYCGCVLSEARQVQKAGNDLIFLKGPFASPHPR